MSRIIKFRVHCKDSGKILAYEYFNANINWGYYWTDATIPEEDRRCNAGPEYFKHPNPLGNIVRVQFTGLHDKNGKEIYEDDLLNVFYTSSDGEYNHDCIYLCQFGQLGIEFSFQKLLWNSFGHNQYPLSTTLCERYETLRINTNGLVVPNKHDHNVHTRHSWKQNDESNYFEVIGNARENPELLK